MQYIIKNNCGGSLMISPTLELSPNQTLDVSVLTPEMKNLVEKGMISFRVGVSAVIPTIPVPETPKLKFQKSNKEDK